MPEVRRGQEAGDLIRFRGMYRALACLLVLGSAAPARADALDDVSARLQKLRGRMAKAPPELVAVDADLKAARTHEDAAADAEARVQVRDPDATAQAKKAVAERRAAGREAQKAA